MAIWEGGEKVNLSDEQYLKQALDEGIINLDEIRELIDTMKRKEYLAKHRYSISQLPDGRWATRIRDEKGKLVVRRRNTREELEDFLVAHYKKYEIPIFIQDVFNLWINEKLQYGEIQKQSYDRYCSDYDRFFGKSELNQKLFKDITESDLEKFIKTSINKHKLTKKTYSGLVTLLNGIFKYGKSNGYTSLSITSFLGDLQLSKSIFAKKYKDTKREVFMDNEIPVVISYLKANPDIWNLGLLLQFQTGMRIGEISALKREDIKENSILVRRTEVKYKDTNGKWCVKVGDVPKTDAGYREILLPPTARWTIEKVLEYNDTKEEFLFTNNGKRIRENTFNKRLSSVCEKLNLLHRTTHKVRKTYGTTLLDSGVVDDAVVAAQMGHADVSTTRQLYYYCNKNQEQKQNQIAKAISF